MPDTFVVNTTTARSVTASPAHQITLYNAGGGTLYYKTTSDVSSSSNDGNVASGASTTFTDGTKWLIAGTVGAKVFITYSQTQDTDAATQAELNTEISTRETKDAERVVGPASATDLRVAIFDGTTGKKVKDGGTLLSALAPKTEVTTEKERAETAEALKVAKETTGAEATTDVLAAKVTGDTKNRVILNADGKVELGKGEASEPDTTIFRSAAETVKVGKKLETEGSVLAASSITAARTGDLSGLNARETADTVGRFTARTSGKVEWSSGSEAADLSIERSAAKVAKLTGKLVITEEAEIDGDLNHDGTNVGFYGVAPAERQVVKKAALTADELALALEKCGIIDVEA